MKKTSRWDPFEDSELRLIVNCLLVRGGGPKGRKLAVEAKEELHARIQFDREIARRPGVGAPKS